VWAKHVHDLTDIQITAVEAGVFDAKTNLLIVAPTELREDSRRRDGRRVVEPPHAMTAGERRAGRTSPKRHATTSAQASHDAAAPVSTFRSDGHNEWAASAWLRL